MMKIEIDHFNPTDTDTGSGARYTSITLLVKFGVTGISKSRRGSDLSARTTMVDS